MKETLKNIKLIALDLDGTTLTRAGLTRRTKETLEEAIRRGFELVIATGRPYVALPKEVLKIKGLRHIIISNGAHIVDKDCNFSFSNYADPIAMEKVRQIMLERDYPVEVFTGGGAFIDRKLYDDLKKNGSTFMGAKYVTRTRKAVDDIFEFWKDHITEIENLNIHFETPEERSKMWDVFKNVEGVSITSSHRNNIEIVADTTSKAAALRILCKELSIEMKNIICFGDSLNDYEMLEESGYAVAMGNACEELKELADEIAPTNEEEGVCYTIRTRLFREEILDLTQE